MFRKLIFLVLLFILRLNNLTISVNFPLLVKVIIELYQLNSLNRLSGDILGNNHVNIGKDEFAFLEFLNLINYHCVWFFASSFRINIFHKFSHSVNCIWPNNVVD
uniref:Secreted protein n=1 Tax=Euplotes crassus TaxID=5936 RepID=A0A7S3P3W2_EUPCR